MINLLANQDDYVFNVLLTPGLVSNEAKLTHKLIEKSAFNALNVLYPKFTKLDVPLKVKALPLLPVV